MKHDLLVEIGCEELPTWAIRLILDHLREEIPELFKTYGLSYSRLRVLGTPRRIVLAMDEVPLQQEDRTEIITGPPKNAAFDSAGMPTKAALGFAAKCGVEVAALNLAQTPKGAYLTYTKHISGKPTGQIIGEALPEILSRIQFKKPMYWSENRYIFIRPIRWILALLGTERMEIHIADVSSKGTTEGHRLLGESGIRVSSREHYFEVLVNNHVILDPDERRNRIASELKKTASDLGGRVHPDDELLEEVSFLSEFPHVIAGDIPAEFLELPAEVLMTVMRKHQKYFTLENSQGQVMPYFLAVIDTDEDRQGTIRQGHEHVLKARLNDAAFYLRVDSEKPLESRIPALGRYQFHVKLGSYQEKTERIRALAKRLLRVLGRDELSAEMDQACRLSKADLATDMVKEFTELQGIMGGLYARREGICENVWQAIYDHYQPLNLQSNSPRSLLGAVLSIADRADTLAGCFGIGMAPKGSSDPFALRRHAQGLIKILWDHELPLVIDEFLEPALMEIGDRMTVPREDAKRELVSFFERRIRFMLQQRDAPYDIVNAVMAVGFNKPLEVYQRAMAVHKIRFEPDFEALAIAFKRVKNILGSSSRTIFSSVTVELLVEEAEKQLFCNLQRVIPQADQHLASGRYYEALKVSASLRPAVDLLFDKVLVMSPDVALRNNRLALLQALAGLFLKVADISEIVAGNAA